MTAYETSASRPGPTPAGDHDSDPQVLQLKQLTPLDQRRLDRAVMILVHYLLSAASKEMESML